jgi:hypothetical protein
MENELSGCLALLEKYQKDPKIEYNMDEFNKLKDSILDMLPNGYRIRINRLSFFHDIPL